MPFAGYKNFADCVRKNSGKSDPKAYCATIMRATEEEGMGPILASEVVDASEATFHTDEETGKMSASVVIIKAGRAKNPRNYRSTTLRKAAKEGIYNGVRMFVNHSNQPPLKRSLQEMVSAVEETTYDPKRDAIIGKVEFFNKDFFDYAQRAKPYMGVSANHRIRVGYVKEGLQTIEDVQEIVGVHSVDWVVYPSAGGEVISFAKESEGAEDVEWNEVTLDQIRENAPQVIAQLRTELAKESEDSDDDGEGTEDKKDSTEGVSLTAEQIEKLVQEQVQSIQDEMTKKASQKDATTKRVREYVSKSGLPARTQARLINLFADALEYDEDSVKESVEDAKAELKEAGAGPKIVGMGASEGSGGESRSTVSVMESVEATFGIKKEADKDKK